MNLPFFPLIPLPSSCEGCPFYKYRNAEGNGFVADKVVEDSEVFFLAQNPGRNEVYGKQLLNGSRDAYIQVVPQPLLGVTGNVFNNKFLPLAGLKRDEVSLGNAIRCRPGRALGGDKADELPIIRPDIKLEGGTSEIVNALKFCKSTHFHPPESTKVVVTMGRHAQLIMTGLTKDEDEYRKKQSVLESWRGYGVEVSNFNIINTVDTSYYHPLLKSEETGERNNKRVRESEGRDKELRGSYKVTERYGVQASKVVFMTMHIAALFYGDNKRFYHATMQDFHKLGRLLKGEWPLQTPSYKTTLPLAWPTYSAFDTEYVPNTNELIRWSLCSKDFDVYCVEAQQSSVIPIEAGSVVLFQNELADMHHLATVVDMSKVRAEDMMLAHSVLWSGEPHSLNYINSIYGALNRYKHLSKDEPQLYSAMDSYEPMYMWRSYFIPEFKRDKQSWGVYRRFRIPLVSIIDKAQRTGIRLDSERLMDVKYILQERLEGYKKRAIEVTGNENFNLGGSKQLKGEIYGYSEEDIVKSVKVKQKRVKAKTAAQQVAMEMLSGGKVMNAEVIEFLKGYLKDVNKK